MVNDEYSMDSMVGGKFIKKIKAAADMDVMST